MTDLWWEVARRPGEPGEPAIVESVRIVADPNPMPHFHLFRLGRR